MPTPELEDVQPLDRDDVHVVKWVVYSAVTWNDPHGAPPLELAVQHPEIARYHEGWGRPGDFGVKIHHGGSLVGAAFARLFTNEDHGHGFVDERTPELGIAVEEASRGRGVGRALMDGLADRARELGMRRLSLSVNNSNPAIRLYDSLGYQAVSVDGDSSIMVIDL